MSWIPSRFLVSYVNMLLYHKTKLFAEDHRKILSATTERQRLPEIDVSTVPYYIVFW